MVARFLKRVSHSEQVNWLVAQAVYVAVFAAGTFIALGILGLDKTVASLMAGAGIITLALGFAFQDIAANLLAGIYLSVRRPFRRGQLIKTQDYFGTVNQINLRWTEVYTQQGQLVMIPNKQVFENPIMNYSALGRRRIDLEIGVSYSDDLARAREVAIQAVEPGLDAPAGPAGGAVLRGVREELGQLRDPREVFSIFLFLSHPSSCCINHGSRKDHFLKCRDRLR